jgi:hypothetical protein
MLMHSRDALASISVHLTHRLLYHSPMGFPHRVHHPAAIRI